MNLLDYEKEHLEYLKKNASECTLFLKKNNEFPINNPCKVALFGSGARHTIKGGTGSGDVQTRFNKTIEEAFIERGFEITTTKWLDDYDEFKKKSFKKYVRDGKRLAHKNGYLSCVYTMGFFEEEKNYPFDTNYDGDICVYVLARNSGEGNDRRNIKGDIKLSDKEIEDILELNKRFKKFMLVLNVGGVVDISPVNEVSNILLLSQLGLVTSDVLISIILGEVYPSGKLSTTWAKAEDHNSYYTFDNLDNTYYEEEIYVGYRYFNSIGKNYLYPFGYGLSYTDFRIKIGHVSIEKMLLTVDVVVKNTGEYKGKEVVQAYVTKPDDVLPNPSIELVDYIKTKELEKGEEELLTFKIDFTKLCSYDPKRAVNLLLKGEYIISIGNSSINREVVAKCMLNNEVVLEQLENKCKNLVESKLLIVRKVDDTKNALTFTLDPSGIKMKTIIYKKDEYIDPMINELSNDKLARICLGQYGKGLAAIVGDSSRHVIGGAGETTLSVPEIKKSLTMADGPAGIRVTRDYIVNEKGVHSLVLDPMMEKMLNFLPKFARPFIVPKKNLKGEVHHQYATQIPVGTALAQSYNNDFITSVAGIIRDEMKLFNVDLWLAPALNIQRSIQCGRNFEYYSEDPYLSGRTAISMIKGIESDKALGVTIKHFCCNNKEFNRNNNNSVVNERVLREIYLKGFEMCIKEANPKAIMTSYNLLNGVHTSESYELINDILRCEWGYDGLIMTDWMQSGRSFCMKAKYKAPYAKNNILAGNDLTMPGSNKDYKNIMKALKKGELQRKDLVISASRIYRSISKKTL